MSQVNIGSVIQFTDATLVRAWNTQAGRTGAAACDINANLYGTIVSINSTTIGVVINAANKSVIDHTDVSNITKVIKP